MKIKKLKVLKLDATRRQQSSNQDRRRASRDPMGSENEKLLELFRTNWSSFRLSGDFYCFTICMIVLWFFLPFRNIVCASLVWEFLNTRLSPLRSPKRSEDDSRLMESLSTLPGSSRSVDVANSGTMEKKMINFSRISSSSSLIIVLMKR